ncbi:MAG: TolC family protein [Vitreoscilla sp.]|nr:TolC family protein [Burkholderiales bacterium]MBP6339294.1 TolC family protein [Vitreoscilla sp.]
MLLHPFPLRAAARAGALLSALLAATLPAQAALNFDDTAAVALAQAPALHNQQLAVDSAQTARTAAATLPDPRLAVGVENLPIAGMGRYSAVADGMSMQRIALMQDMPNAAKREARAAGAEAKAAREQAMLVVTRLGIQRDAQLAWLGVHFAERKLAQLSELERESQLLLNTLDAHIASGKAMPADKLMARQEALALADRRDEAERDVAKARATLRRWVGERATEPLTGEPPVVTLKADEARAAIHRHAELAPYTAMRAMADAEAREMDAEQRGDWAWEVAYQRRGPQYGDMVSFQISMDLPWQKERRQKPIADAKRLDAARVETERQNTVRMHQEELDGWLAEWQALQAQRERLARLGEPLAAERVKLTLSGYEAGRSDLASVLAARREAVETHLRLTELDAQIAALNVRLTTLIAE